MNWSRESSSETRRRSSTPGLDWALRIDWMTTRPVPQQGPPTDGGHILPIVQVLFYRTVATPLPLGESVDRVPRFWAVGWFAWEHNSPLEAVVVFRGHGNQSARWTGSEISTVGFGAGLLQLCFEGVECCTHWLHLVLHFITVALWRVVWKMGLWPSFLSILSCEFLSRTGRFLSNS